MKRILLTMMLLAMCVSSFAQSFHVNVVGISDGDTFTAINRDNLQLKIRVYGIDAPEKRQPFGNKSKEALSDLIFGKDIVIDVQSQDRYGRFIAYAFTPSGEDVSLLMLNKGMAWHYTEYDSSEKYAAAEQSARKKRIGLCSDSNTVAPWEFRKK